MRLNPAPKMPAHTSNEGRDKVNGRQISTPLPLAKRTTGGGRQNAVKNNQRSRSGK